ncbi:MAG: hypothetical protein ABID83_02970 [Candidatus Omnitrophota bacterium]
MKSLTLFVLICAICCSAGCDTPQEYIEIDGTVRYVSLEGGFWGITVADGRKFDPVNLPERFKKDGLRVSAKLRPRDDLAGFHMWGQIVEIEEIRPSEI